MWDYAQRHGRIVKMISMEDKIGFFISTSSLDPKLIMKRLSKCTGIKKE